MKNKINNILKEVLEKVEPPKKELSEIKKFLNENLEVLRKTLTGDTRICVALENTRQT